MNKVKLVVVSVFVLFSVCVQANQATGLAKITILTNWVGTVNNPNETLLIATDSAVVNPAGCSKTDKYNLQPASEISRSLVLGAYFSKSLISLNIGSGGCASDNRPIVVSVDLAE